METILYYEKSFLLKYYLEFTSNIKNTLVIKKNIKLRDQVQFEIVREILSTYFEDTLPKASSIVNLSEQIAKVESKSRISCRDKILSARFAIVTLRTLMGTFFVNKAK